MQRKNKISIWKYAPFLAGLAGAVFFGTVKGNSEQTKKIEVAYLDQNRERQIESYKIWDNAIKGITEYDNLKYDAKIAYENKESQPQQAVEYSLSLQLGEAKEYRSKLRGIEPNWSNKNESVNTTKTLVRLVDEADIKDIKNRVRTRIRPTEYAGSLCDGGKVKILEENTSRTRVTKVEGLASWYSAEDSSPRTATGADVEDDKRTVAVNERLGYPLPCKVRITNLDNGLNVEAIATDHGPYKFNEYGNAVWKSVKRGKDVVTRYIPHDTRIVDTSIRVAKDLGFYHNGKGLAHVRIEYLGMLK